MSKFLAALAFYLVLWLPLGALPGHPASRVAASPFDYRRS